MPNITLEHAKNMVECFEQSTLWINDRYNSLSKEQKARFMIQACRNIFERRIRLDNAIEIEFQRLILETPFNELQNL